MQDELGGDEDAISFTEGEPAQTCVRRGMRTSEGQQGHSGSRIEGGRGCKVKVQSGDAAQGIYGAWGGRAPATG